MPTDDRRPAGPLHLVTAGPVDRRPDASPTPAADDPRVLVAFARAVVAFGSDAGAAAALDTFGVDADRIVAIVTAYRELLTRH